MKRKYLPVRNHPGIYKVLIQVNERKWEEPLRGGKYAAAKHSKLGGQRIRQKRHFATFAEAKDFKDGRESSLAGVERPFDTKSLEGNEGLLLCEIFARYEKNELIHRAVNTRDKYKAYCKFFEPLWNVPVTQISAFKIDDWLSWLKSPEQRAQYSTRRCNFDHEFTFLKVLLGYYRETFDFEYRMPFLKRHRQNLKIKEVSFVQKDLSPDQAFRFFEALRKRGDDFFYYLAQMQYSTFTRIQETVALHFEDFDFESGFVTINKKIIFRRVGGCTRELVAGAKAGKGKRICITTDLAKSFREWTLRTGVRTGPLFKTEETWPSYRSIQHAYDSAFRAAGIPFSGTHILRHASLSEAQEAGGDIKITQVLAGHQSLLTTERYAKARESKIREVQRQVGLRVFEGHGSQ